MVQAACENDPATTNQLAGFIKGLDFVLTGALDEYARNVLGFTEEPPKPLEDYMPLEPVE